MLRARPTNSPDSIPVRHPVHSRYPAAAGRLPSAAPSPDTQLQYRYTLRLHLAGSKTCQTSPEHWYVGSPLRTCAVPGTQPSGCTGQISAVTFCAKTRTKAAIKNLLGEPGVSVRHEVAQFECTQ